MYNNMPIRRALLTARCVQGKEKQLNNGFQNDFHASVPVGRINQDWDPREKHGSITHREWTGGCEGGRQERNKLLILYSQS